MAQTRGLDSGPIGGLCKVTHQNIATGEYDLVHATYIFAIHLQFLEVWQRVASFVTSLLFGGESYDGQRWSRHIGVGAELTPGASK